jgi:N-acetylglucosamine malate deacetylase 1
MKVLVISVHPDDETLGCGGAILRHRENGDQIFWLIVTQANEPDWPGEVIKIKAKEVDSVSHAYGMDSYEKLGLPTIRLDTVPQADLIEKIKMAVERIRPEIVYMVHVGDVHSDHQVVFYAAMSVLRPSYMASIGVRRHLCYETLSSTEATPAMMNRAFIPNVFIDISPFLERKLQIMSLYETEVQRDPMPRGPSAIRALARYRGATIGVFYAEAFMLIREIMPNEAN